MVTPASQLFFARCLHFPEGLTAFNDNIVHTPRRLFRSASDPSIPPSIDTMRRAIRAFSLTASTITALSRPPFHINRHRAKRPGLIKQPFVQSFREAGHYAVLGSYGTSVEGRPVHLEYMAGRDDLKTAFPHPDQSASHRSLEPGDPGATHSVACARHRHGAGEVDSNSVSSETCAPAYGQSAGPVPTRSIHRSPLTRGNAGGWCTNNSSRDEG